LRFEAQEVGPAVLSHVEHRADVRMAQRGERLRFALESLLHRWTGSNVRREHLDRDDAIQPSVSCLVDLAHSARPERAEDLEGTESSANRESHRLSLTRVALRLRSGRP
jgi:hypothetical protein